MHTEWNVSHTLTNLQSAFFVWDKYLAKATFRRFIFKGILRKQVRFVNPISVRQVVYDPRQVVYDQVNYMNLYIMYMDIKSYISAP